MFIMSRPTTLVFLAVLIASGCSSSTDGIVPLQYHQQYAANVSTLYDSVGHERKNLQDSYAPEFHWRRADGTADSLSGHRGSLIMLNFWATWCAPCKYEMPFVQELANDMKDSLFVIGIAVDNQGDAFSTVRNYVQSNNLSYQFVVDSFYRLYEKYELFPPTTPVPVSVFIDADGLIRYSVTGAAGKESDFLAIIRRYLQ